MFGPSTYLFHYRKLTIPEVGSIELQAQSAFLDFAEKVIHPPAYKIIFSKGVGQGDRSAVQIAEYNYQLDVKEELAVLGQTIQKHIEHDRFHWRGVGSFQKRNSTVDFVQDSIFTGLQPISAHKVIRQHAKHNVLRGETEILSSAEEQVHVKRKKVSLVTLITWILVLAALIFTGVYLYQHHFAPESSGMQTKIKPAAPVPTYK